MFLKKIKNKISEMQNDINNMQNKLEQYNTKMEKSLDKLERIMQNGRSDKITCECHWNYLNNVTHIYKNMREYTIKGLKLSDSAICKQGEKENIIYITDTYTKGLNNQTVVTEKYIVDLYNESYIFISKSKVDIPKEGNESIETKV